VHQQPPDLGDCHSRAAPARLHDLSKTRETSSAGA
jgi:hypothetical protein